MFIAFSRLLVVTGPHPIAFSRAKKTSPKMLGKLFSLLGCLPFRNVKAETNGNLIDTLFVHQLGQ